MGKGGYSTKTNEEVLQKSHLFDKVNKRLLWKFIISQKYYYIIFIVVILISFPLQYAAIPTTVADIIEGLAKHGIPMNEKFTNFWKNIKSKNVAGAIVTLLILWIIVTILYMSQETLAMKIFPRHLHHIRQEMVAGLIERHKEEYDDIPSGEAITRVLDVSRLYAYQTEYVFVTLIPYMVGLIVVLVYTMRTNKTLGIIAMVGLGAVIANNVFWGVKISNLSSVREGKYIYMVENMNNNFNNLMAVYINNKEKDAINDNNKLNEEHTQMFQKELQFARNSNGLSTFISVIVLVVILITGYHKVKHNQLKASHLGALVTVYVMYLHWSLELFHELPYVFRRFGIWQNSYGFVENLFRTSDSQRSNFKITTGAVELDNISFVYPSEDIPVLKNFNLKVNPGERVAIIGRSGSGKTTIMKLIVNLYKPTGGKVLLDGHDAQDIKIHEIRDKINYINQRTTLLNDSIMKNMQYGNDASAEEIKALLKKYDLLVVFSDIPDGIMASAGVNGGNLSLGMQKTVILVRGILKRNSVVYIFDEPVAGLDSNTRQKIMNMINTECAGKTVICVSHLAEIQEFVERVIPINKTTSVQLWNKNHYYKVQNTLK
jgi:ABC-type multidrug transport system fused ATPase/permease subunit